MTLDDLYGRKDLLDRMGLTARQNDEGGYHLFETDSMNRVNDPSVLQEALNSVDSRDAQGRLAYGTGGPLTYAGNRFLPGTVDLNGASYTQAEHPYDTLAGIPEYAKYLQQAGVTPNDFSYDETYGHLMANNDRTAAYRTLLGNSIAKQNEGGIVDRLASSGPIILGSAGASALSAPAIASGLGVSTGIAKGIASGVLGLATSGGNPISAGIGALSGYAGDAIGNAIGDAPTVTAAADTAGGLPQFADASGISGTATDAPSVGAGSLDAPTELPVLPETLVTASPISPSSDLGTAALTGAALAAPFAFSGIGGSGVTLPAGQAGAEAQPSADSPESADTGGVTQASVDTALGTGAFDMGQFSPADVGLQTDTGAFDMGQFTAADVGLGATPLSNMAFPGGGGGGDGFYNGSDSSSSTDSQAFYEEAANTDTVSDPFNASSGVQSALDKALKFGPLGLGIAGLLSQSKAKNETQRFAQQIAQIGGPQRAVGQQLLNDFQSGTLNPADASRINSWEQSALAQARQYFARAGTSTGTSANATYRDIAAKAEQMRQQALQALLTQGLNALNITDKYQADAIKAELQADTAARAQTLSFMNSLGNITARLPAILGSTGA